MSALEILRLKVGLIAIVLLGAYGVLYVWPLENAEHQPMVQGALVRIGAVMGAIWLALPDLRRMPIWLLSVTIASLALIAVRPKTAVFIIPLLVLFSVLKPSPPKAKRRARK